MLFFILGTYYTVVAGVLVASYTGYDEKIFDYMYPEYRDKDKDPADTPNLNTEEFTLIDLEDDRKV